MHSVSTDDQLRKESGIDPQSTQIQIVLGFCSRDFYCSSPFFNPNTFTSMTLVSYTFVISASIFLHNRISNEKVTTRIESKVENCILAERRFAAVIRLLCESREGTRIPFLRTWILIVSLVQRIANIMELLFSHPRFFILHAPETGNALSQQTAQPQWYKRGIIPCSPSRTPRCTSYNTSVPASHSTATQLPRVASSVSDTSCDTPCHSCRRAANRDRSAFSGKSIHHLYSTLPLDNDHPAA